MNKFKKLYKAYKKTNKSVFLVYILLRVLVMTCLVLQIIEKNYNNVFFCVLTLILFTLPFFVQKNFKIEIPNTLEVIIMVFIFSAEILGEVNSFYLHVPNFDTIMHTLNGFLCCGIGFSLFDLLNTNVKSFKLTPFYLTLVAFCFSMTVGVVWEFFEYGNDVLLKTDMQKDTLVKTISSVEFNELGLNKAITIDNIDKTVITFKDNNGNVQTRVIDGGYLDIGIHDTMKDLLVNFVGACVFSVFGYIHLKNKEKYKFTEGLYIKKKD